MSKRHRHDRRRPQHRPQLHTAAARRPWVDHAPDGLPRTVLVSCGECSDGVWLPLQTALDLVSDHPGGSACAGPGRHVWDGRP